MSTHSPDNDLHDFMRKLGRDMQEEYERITKRSAEDAGTAGDEGEENWARLLRDWLPPAYRVVTKGRIMFADGRASPQVDVIVLRPWYPIALENTKTYLSAGVAAAFECKLTLRSGDITEAVGKAATIRSLEPDRQGTTPYKELHSAIVYGLLAHSHEWKKEKSTPVENVERTLREKSKGECDHPRKALNLVCVADAASWYSQAWFRDERLLPTPQFPDGGQVPSFWFRSEATLAFMRELEGETPVGAFLTNLLRCLSWQDETLRGMYRYFQAAGLTRRSAAQDHQAWPLEQVLSVGTYRRLPSKPQAGQWNEWSMMGC